MLYEIHIGSPKLDKSYFPPNLELDVSINNETGKSLPILIYFAVYLQSAENSFTYWLPRTPAAGKSSFRAVLAFEYVAFLKAAMQLKNSDGLNVNIMAKIIAENGVEIANHSVSYGVDKQLWILAMDEDKKPRPTGLKAHHHFAAVLDEKIGDLERRTADDPITQLQRRAFEGQINVIKEYLLDQPEMKKLKGFEPVLEICAKLNIDSRWAIAAALLSSLEGYMKNWLVKHTDEKLEDLKRKEFDELISKIQKALLAKKVAFQQKKLSDLAGKRHLRNQVIHEMYIPTDDEIAEIKDESIEFVKYIESIFPTD